MGDPPAKRPRKPRLKGHVCRNVMASGEPCGKAFATPKKLLEHREGKSTLNGATLRKARASGCNSRAQTVVKDQVRAPQGFWAGISAG